MTLKNQDKTIFNAIEKEKKRQFEGLELIPSENYVSEAVLEAMGSILTNKYSEGFVAHRYYGGNIHIDEIENEAVQRAKALFGVAHVNVQPYSGSPANFAVYHALLNPGDAVSGMNLFDGGHLTHGWKVSATARYFESHPYHVLPEGIVDYDELEQIAKEHKPKLIWCGATAYPRVIEWAKFAKIADSIGAYLVADISHISGLVAAGVHESPVPYVHVITTTTHKTLRGPRGAMIMVTKKGLEKDPEISSKIDKAIFPGLQGGPHNHTTAAIAVALQEASTPEFKEYAKQIVKNTKTLEAEFKKSGINMVSAGSDNHLLLLDLSSNGSLGSQLEYAMDVAHMTANKNTIPGEPSSPYYPSGLRLGTPALTTRGFQEKDMVKVADWITRVIRHIEKDVLPKEQSERAAFIKAFKAKAAQDPFLKAIGQEIKAYTKDFPIPGTK
ncbi:MAG: serine hydroxymethyltransferase [bacterium]|nr:serine hydroxymethyltransferase [bacterium]RIK52066.1 MAG: serine hydroxymethyltransferase [Candidatus Microgenomates bacterium]